MIFPRKAPRKILCEQCERMRQPALIGGKDLELHLDLIIRDINNSNTPRAYDLFHCDCREKRHAKSCCNKVNDGLARTDLNTVMQIKLPLRKILFELLTVIRTVFRQNPRSLNQLLQAYGPQRVGGIDRRNELYFRAPMIQCTDPQAFTQAIQ